MGIIITVYLVNSLFVFSMFSSGCFEKLVTSDLVLCFTDVHVFYNANTVNDS